MTEQDIQEPHESGELTERQRKAIPFLVGSHTYEEGRKKARISKNALYEWLKNPSFKEALRKQRDALITEALVLAANRKGLAWRPAGNQLNTVLPLIELDLANVLVEQLKFGTHGPQPVLSEGLA